MARIPRISAITYVVIELTKSGMSKKKKKLKMNGVKEKSNERWKQQSCIGRYCPKIHLRRL